MTEHAVGRALKRWLLALRLQEWETRLVVVRSPILTTQGEVGHLEADHATMAAVITVAADRPAADVAETCLHEALHLALADLTETFNRVTGLLGHDAAELAAREFAAAGERAALRLQRAIQEVSR